MPVGDDGSLVFSGDNGWAAFFADDEPQPLAYLRFLPERPDDEQPYYEVAALYMIALTGPITGRELRTLPLGRMLATVNHTSNAGRMRLLTQDRTGGMGVDIEGDLDELRRLHEDSRRRNFRSRRPRMTLHVPEGHRKPDSFYEQVAYRYGWLKAEGLRPAQELADANGVPVTTVHRWVKEARRRGLMAPGQRASRRSPS